MATKTRTRRMDMAAQAWQDSLTYTVKGPSPFPVDMLRYDQAVPATETDSNIIDRSLYTDDVEVHEVTLRSLKPPTLGRWDSFRWIVKCDCARGECAQHLR